MIAGKRTMDPTAERLEKTLHRAAAALHRRLAKGAMPEPTNAREAAERIAEAATLLGTCSAWEEAS